MHIKSAYPIFRVGIEESDMFERARAYVDQQESMMTQKADGTCYLKTLLEQKAHKTQFQRGRSEGAEALLADHSLVTTSVDKVKPASRGKTITFEAVLLAISLSDSWGHEIDFRGGIISKKIPGGGLTAWVAGINFCLYRFAGLEDAQYCDDYKSRLDHLYQLDLNETNIIQYLKSYLIDLGIIRHLANDNRSKRACTAVLLRTYDFLATKISAKKQKEVEPILKWLYLELFALKADRELVKEIEKRKELTYESSPFHKKAVLKFAHGEYDHFNVRGKSFYVGDNEACFLIHRVKVLCVTAQIEKQCDDKPDDILNYLVDSFHGVNVDGNIMYRESFKLFADYLDDAITKPEGSVVVDRYLDCLERYHSLLANWSGKELSLFKSNIPVIVDDLKYVLALLLPEDKAPLLQNHQQSGRLMKFLKKMLSQLKTLPGGETAPLIEILKTYFEKMLAMDPQLTSSEMLADGGAADEFVKIYAPKRELRTELQGKRRAALEGCAPIEEGREREAEQGEQVRLDGLLNAFITQAASMGDDGLTAEAMTAFDAISKERFSAVQPKEASDYKKIMNFLAKDLCIKFKAAHGTQHFKIAEENTKWVAFHEAAMRFEKAFQCLNKENVNVEIEASGDVLLKSGLTKQDAKALVKFSECLIGETITLAQGRGMFKKPSARYTSLKTVGGNLAEACARYIEVFTAPTKGCKVASGQEDGAGADPSPDTFLTAVLENYAQPTPVATRQPAARSAGGAAAGTGAANFFQGSGATPGKPGAPTPIDFPEKNEAVERAVVAGLAAMLGAGEASGMAANALVKKLIAAGLLNTAGLMEIIRMTSTPDSLSREPTMPSPDFPAPSPPGSPPPSPPASEVHTSPEPSAPPAPGADLIPDDDSDDGADDTSSGRPPRRG
jgi:hypothetical protein